MNVQFAVEQTVKDEHTSMKLTNLAPAQPDHHNGTDLNQTDFEVDPELPGEIEINLSRDMQVSARTRTTMSGKSVKSKKSDGAENRASIVRSRGRPIKPHETEPFLSIDNLPADKTFVTEKTQMSAYTPRPSTNKSGVPAYDRSPLLPQNSNYMSPYCVDTPAPPSPSVVSDKKSPLPGSAPLSVSRPTSGRSLQFHFVPHIDPSMGSQPESPVRPVSGSRSGGGSARPKSGSRSRASSRAGSRPGSQARGRANVGQMRSLPSRNGRVTPANTPFQAANKQYRVPNCHVKTPFKHAVMKPAMTPDGRVTPSQGLKERTTLAANHLNRILTVAVEKEAVKTPGKLKKGKLKPLYPVNLQGPSIEKCRGIISETRQYGASPSRTLQRRMHLINTIPNVHEYLYDRPRTVESVHRTSIASSVDDNLNDTEYTNNLDSNRLLPDETLYPLPQSTSILEPVTPENTFVPVQTQENTQENIVLTDRNNRTFATEINPNDPGLDENDEVLSQQLQQDLYIGEAHSLRKHPPKLQTDKNNSNPQHGDTEQDKEDEENDADPSRVASASKSVRFVESGEDADVENAKDIKQKTNANIAKMDRAKQELEEVEEREPTDGEKDQEEDTVNKKNKMNKASCKSDDITDIYRKDQDDDDDGGSDGNKNNSANKPRDTGSDTSSGKQGSGGKKGEISSGKTESKGDNNGKQASGFKCTNQRSQSGSVSRPKSSGTRSRGSDTGRTTPVSGSRAGSKSGHCSKFERSKASKSHTPSLQVSAVIHGDSVSTTLRPESPSRSPSRPVSPSRRTSTRHSNSLYSQQSATCFSPQFLNNNLEFHMGELACETQDGFSNTDTISDYYDNYNQKSRVKFMIEGETPEVDTIFIEEDDEVVLRRDRDITFDALDTELAALRTTIQHQIEHNIESVHTTEDEEEEESEQDSETGDGELEGETESVAIETVRGDYSNLLDKYRQRCMDRSEAVGAISSTLVTPRDGSAKLWQRRARSHGSRRPSDAGSDGKHSSKSRGTNKSTLTDSGRGSVDNLSEMSKTVSTAVSEVPRLELGSNCSDLGLGTARSDVTEPSDVLVTETRDEEVPQEPDTRNLLELVCESLAPTDMEVKAESRKNVEEDLSALKVVATTKSLSKTKKKKSVNASCAPAPFPPICFTINARPPRGYLYYFAYGPDMNPDRLTSYLQREVKDRYWALLFGFNLVFNKRGSSEEAGGFANIEFNPLRSVEGCLYKLTQHELHVLDKCLGYPEHYQHLVLPVWMANSREPDALGVAQYCVPALTYIAQNNWTETEKTLPCDYAASQCLKSADILTPEYRESLVSMGTQQQLQMSA